MGGFLGVWDGSAAEIRERGRTLAFFGDWLPFATPPADVSRLFHLKQALFAISRLFSLSTVV